MFPIRDHNPSLRTPYVTYALIALNVVVFLLYLPLLGDEARLVAFFDRWALTPAYAIAGVMGGYLLLFPRARVDVLVILVIVVRMIALPAWVMLGFWFALQAFNSYSTFGPAEGGVAHLAHTGGFVAGALLTLPLLLRRGGAGFWRRTRGAPPHPPTLVGARLTPIPRVPRSPR
jgi:membrane associated rhomboid family serine protease